MKRDVESKEVENRLKSVQWELLWPLVAGESSDLLVLDFLIFVNVKCHFGGSDTDLESLQCVSSRSWAQG